MKKTKTEQSRKDVSKSNLEQRERETIMGFWRLVNHTGLSRDERGRGKGRDREKLVHLLTIWLIDRSTNWITFSSLNWSIANRKTFFSLISRHLHPVNNRSLFSVNTSLPLRRKMLCYYATLKSVILPIDNMPCVSITLYMYCFKFNICRGVMCVCVRACTRACVWCLQNLNFMSLCCLKGERDIYCPCLHTHTHMYAHTQWKLYSLKRFVCCHDTGIKIGTFMPKFFIQLIFFALVI